MVNLYQTPLTALKPSTRESLGLMLDSRKIIPTDKNYLRDWRGLAELVGLGAIWQNAWNNKQNCKFTEEVLKDWQRLPDPKVPPNVGSLQDLLKDLDRWDVYDDLTPVFEVDAERHFACEERSLEVVENEGDEEAITVDDLDQLAKGLSLQQYDAMLLYDDKDACRAKEILDNLEERNIKVFEKNRDLVPGVFEFDAAMELIANRCNKIIVIFSDDLFQNRNINSFLVSFAQSVGIETNTRKVVPVTFKMCTIPKKFNFYFRLDHAKIEKFGNFYDKLYDSVKPSHFPPSTPRNKMVTQAAPVEDKECDTASSVDSAYLTNASCSTSKAAVVDTTTSLQLENSKKKPFKIPKIFKKKKKVAQPLLAQ